MRPTSLPSVVDDARDLPADFALADVPVMPPVSSVLMCPPTYFDVIDVKNAFMAGRAGTVDRRVALAQWDCVRAAIGGAGIPTRVVEPLTDAEDMVFCANPVLLGIDAELRKLCVRGRMAYASRQPEVDALAARCESEGYRVVDLDPPVTRFEGGGDAIWHPGRRLLWGGFGARTVPEAYPELATLFGATVIRLALVDPTYYHLDTCFCALDERTVLVYPPALAPDGMRLVRRMFERVLEVDGGEAAAFACNATALPNGWIVIDRRASRTVERLRALDYAVVEVDTGEFLKSGGSVYCMKCFAW